MVPSLILVTIANLSGPGLVQHGPASKIGTTCHSLPDVPVLEEPGIEGHSKEGFCLTNHLKYVRSMSDPEKLSGSKKMSFEMFRPEPQKLP